MIKFSIQSNCHFLAKLLSTVQSHGIHDIVFNTFEGKSAISGSGHVERTSLLFAAVESHLGERQVSSELSHGT